MTLLKSVHVIDQVPMGKRVSEYGLPEFDLFRYKLAFDNNIVKPEFCGPMLFSKYYGIPIKQFIELS